MCYLPEVTPPRTLGDTLGNAALTPLWLAGRLLRLLARTVSYMWAAFNDGLDAGASDDTHSDTALALVVVWLIVLTIIVIV